MPWMRGPSVVRPGPTTSTSMSGTFQVGGPTFGIVAIDFDTGVGAIRRAPQGGISPSGQLNGGSGSMSSMSSRRGGHGPAAGSTTASRYCHTSSHGFLNHLSHYHLPGPVVSLRKGSR